jgi:glycosyltransferase involved in cell wall biosynthesis
VRQTPLFIANSQPAREFLVHELDARPERVHVVLDRVAPMELDSLRAEAREWIGVEPNVTVVSMLAHLHAVKDHATLLRAWRLVLDASRDPQPVLLLAGRPSGTEDAVKALAYDLDLGRSVRFLGDVENVQAVLAASDLAVLSSRSESRPHALLESAAAGLPIAATDAPGIRAALGEHQAPYLAPVGDADTLAQFLTSLIADPDLRARLGRENRRLTGKDAASAGAGKVDLIARALRS